MTSSFVDGVLGPTIPKDPDAVLDYTFKWGGWLSEIGDTITTSTMTVASGLTKDSNTNTAKEAVVWLSGGTVGSTYAVTNKIVTVGGRTEERTIYIEVKDR